MKTRALAFLSVVSVWLIFGQIGPSEAAVQCQYGGSVAIVQYHFQNTPKGNSWYCSVAGGSSEHACIYDQASFCQTACSQCGATLINSDPCVWNRSVGSAPGDPGASICAASYYAQFYRMTCNCWPNCKDVGESCGAAGDCCEGLYCNTQGQCDTIPSPLMINLRSNSAQYHLTSAANGVLFDIDADGNRDQVAWTQSGSEVAFLALDRNHNGSIDDGSELFGTATMLSTGRRAANGFDALYDLDGGPGTSDGQVRPSDAAYGELRLWIDDDHNGVSGPGELITLSDADVTAVFTS